MADLGDPIDTGYEPPPKQKPWGVISAVIAFVLLGVLAFWITHEKKNDQARQEVLNALDKDLVEEEEAIKAQREKVVSLTQQVEALRTSIQLGQVQNKAKAVSQFNELAAQQRAERDKFTSMAEAYNKKVAEYRNLEQ
jgi:ribosomal protein L17